MKVILYVMIGFAAQMVDGTLGMAYGVTCRTFLKTIVGLPASVTSAVVHVAELPTTFVSGIAHLKFKNVEFRMLVPLVASGVLGGICGVWFLSNTGGMIEPIIELYLFIMGLRIVSASKEGVIYRFVFLC